jgi:hypothetical protein
MQPTRRSLAAAAVLLVLAGCGRTERATGPPPPRLPRSLAHDFAARSEDIARLLDAGDACGALDAAKKLQQRSIALIGRVPPEYQETLQGTINHIVERIRCVPPPPPAATTATGTDRGPDVKPPKKEKHHGKGHGKHKKHGDDDD